MQLKHRLNLFEFRAQVLINIDLLEKELVIEDLVITQEDVDLTEEAFNQVFPTFHEFLILFVQ